MGFARTEDNVDLTRKGEKHQEGAGLPQSMRPHFRIAVDHGRHAPALYSYQAVGNRVFLDRKAKRWILTNIMKIDGYHKQPRRADSLPPWTVRSFKKTPRGRLNRTGRWEALCDSAPTSVARQPSCPVLRPPGLACCLVFCLSSPLGSGSGCR